jgi:acyl carrier protein
MNLAPPMPQTAATAAQARPCTTHDLIALIEQELALAAGQLSADSLVAHLGDSLDWVSVLGALEAHYRIRIEATDTTGLDTLADLVERVAELQRV